MTLDQIAAFVSLFVAIGILIVLIALLDRCIYVFIDWREKFVSRLRMAGEPDFQYKATHWMDCSPADTIDVMIESGDVYTERYSDRYSDREIVCVGPIDDFEPDRFIPIGEKR